MIGIFLIVSNSCEKSEQLLPFSEIPEIELVRLSHDTIKEYVDVLTITIRYRDGDGDLGFEEPEKYAVFIRDARLQTFDGFYLGPIAPPGQRIAIQGTLSVEFPSLFVFGNRSQESTKFFIYMVDRAGNKSNEIETPTILIMKP